MNQQELKKLEDKVLSTLRKYLTKNSTVIAGISGGPDSSFLLYTLQKLEKYLPVKIVIAHVNHMLRGKESILDEKFVKALGKGEKQIVKVLKKDIDKLSKTLKKGLEETGRKVRYEYFQNLAKKYKAKFIITAHHADDNLETIIMNFVRGSGIKGLSGMKEIEKLSENLSLLRPLLNISKKTILDFLKTKKIPYRTDKSNKNILYKRNYIRHKIIPSLQKLNPNIADTVAKNSSHLREISKLLETQSYEWLQKNSLNKSFTKFNAKTLRKLPKILQKEIIIQIYKKFTGNTQNLETPQIEEILKIINSGLGNKQKKLGKLIFHIQKSILTVKLEKIRK